MFVHNRFSQAYIFPEQSYEFGTDDVIDPAPGPVTLKARVVTACKELLPSVDTERQEVLNQVIDTIDDSDAFLLAVKEEVDGVWLEARRYQVAHPTADKKGAEPATDKQIKWLRELGCPTVPKTKSEASKLIDKYKGNTNGTRYAKRRPALT